MKVFAKPNAPLSTLVAPLIEQVMELAKYDDVQKLRKDYEDFKRYVDSLEKRIAVNP